MKNTCEIFNKDGQRAIDAKSIESLTECVFALPQTKTFHLDKNGDYTAERRKLHEEIIKEFKDDVICIDKGKPIAVLMGGSPASGKSTFLKKYRPYLLSDNLFKVDADEIRAKLPEYKGWNATQTHEETGDIVKTLISDKNIGVPCKFDFIYDGTMTSVKKYLALIDLLKSEGYEVFVVFISNIPQADVKQRALERYQKSGRFVPMMVVDDFYKNGEDTFKQVKTQVDGYIVVDGSTFDYNVMEKGGKSLPNKRLYEKLGHKIELKNGGQMKTYKIIYKGNIRIETALNEQAAIEQAKQKLSMFYGNIPDSQLIAVEMEIPSNKFAEGGPIENTKDPQFIQYNGDEIMFVPVYGTYWVNDEEFETIEQAKSYIDEGYEPKMFAKGGKTETFVVLNEGNGVVVNKLFNEWNNIKSESNYDKWAKKVKSTTFGTYGTISLNEVLDKFDFDKSNLNTIVKNDFRKEINNVLKSNKYAKGGQTESKVIKHFKPSDFYKLGGSIEEMTPVEKFFSQLDYSQLPSGFAEYVNAEILTDPSLEFVSETDPIFVEIKNKVNSMMVVPTADTFSAMDTEMNKKIADILAKNNIKSKEDFIKVIRATLSDSNFHSEAMSFVKDLDSTITSDKEAYRSEWFETDSKINDVSSEISILSDYDGIVLKNGFVFALKMNGYHSVADSLEKAFVMPSQDNTDENAETQEAIDLLLELAEDQEGAEKAETLEAVELLKELLV